jgi:hypothetical protein
MDPQIGNPHRGIKPLPSPEGRGFRSDANRRATFSASLLRLVLLFALVTNSACNLSSAPGGGTPSPIVSSGKTQTVSPQPGTTPSITQPAPADLADVTAIARQIYDQVQASQDLAPLLGGIFAGLGIQVLSASADGNQGLALIKAGKPVVFDAQLETIGQGYTQGMAVNVDSLMADLSAHGVMAANPSGPLTSTYLKTAMLSLAGKTSYSPAETLPALVIALGQERAKRLSLTGADPVWGDGWLDPLQYALLLYGFSFRGILTVAGVQSPDPAVNSGLVTWVEDRLGQGSSGFFDNLMNSLNQLNVPDYIICGLYYISNSRLVLSGPSWVYHKQTDVTNPDPYQAMIKATLFLTAPTPRESDFMALAGCPTPPATGAFPNKPIHWSLDSVAQQHGSFTSQETTTNADGTATATYTTIDEKTPQAGRLPLALQKAQAGLTAEATDLVPGHPQLEAGGRLLGSGVSNTYPLEIRFYAALALDIGGTYQIPGKDVTITNVLANQTIPLTASNGVLQGNGSFQISSSATFNCGSGGTVQAKGSFTGRITVMATPGSGANNDQLFFSFIPDLSTLKPPAANIQCVAGDLNDVAWAGFASILGAKFTLSSTTLSYDFTPPAATGKITFTLHAVKP